MLHHLLAFEEDDYQDHDNNHHGENANPDIWPFRKWKGYVHSVETGYKGGWHKQQGDEGKHFHNPVLVQINNTHYGVLQIFQSLKGEVDMVYQ